MMIWLCIIAVPNRPSISEAQMALLLTPFRVSDFRGRARTASWGLRSHDSSLRFATKIVCRFYFETLSQFEKNTTLQTHDLSIYKFCFVTPEAIR